MNRLGSCNFQEIHYVKRYVSIKFSDSLGMLEDLFAITAAGVLPCGGPKKSPRTSSIVQIIFFF